MLGVSDFFNCAEFSPGSYQHMTRSKEETHLSAMYRIDARHESDLKKQVEQIAAFEAAAESGDWKLFKRIVNGSGDLFLTLMRQSDDDSRLRLPLFQSGELEASFRKSLKTLNKDWTDLMPPWARFGYRFETALTWISGMIALGAVGQAVTGSPDIGGLLGVIALAILILVDNSEPGVRRNSKWWVRFVYPRPRPILSRWRTASYVLATLMIMWFMLEPVFQTPGDLCSGMSPEELATHRGCSPPDPFAQ